MTKEFEYRKYHDKWIIDQVLGALHPIHLCAIDLEASSIILKNNIEHFKLFEKEPRYVSRLLHIKQYGRYLVPAFTRIYLYWNDNKNIYEFRGIREATEEEVKYIEISETQDILYDDTLRKHLYNILKKEFECSQHQSTKTENGESNKD